MKNITRKLTSLAVLVGIGLSLPLTTLAHSPDNNHEGKRYKEVWCGMTNRAQDRLFGRFDQDNSRLTKRLQMLINRENKIPCEPKTDIVDTLVENGNFSTLVTAVSSAGLVDTLKSEGKFTLFAPTDQAFAKLPAGTIPALLNDLPTLTSILKYHVVSGEVPASVASTLTSAPTVNGKNITIKLENHNLFINDSRVVLYDIYTTNGVIHVIDTVLLPN